MKYTGRFKNIKEETIQVNIITNNSTAEETEIYFADESPVVITQQSSDGIFSPIKSRSCTITIVTKDVYLDMYSASSHGTKVVVNNLNTGECLFYGYLTPCEYNQPFTYLNEIELEAIDAVSTLQDFKYTPISQTGINYVKDLLKYALTTLLDYDNVYIPKNGNKIVNITSVIDGSIYSSQVDSYPTKYECISDLTFSNDDGYITWYEIIEEICKFYGLSLVPYHNSVYLVDYKIIDYCEEHDLNDYESIDPPTANSYVEEYLTIRSLVDSNDIKIKFYNPPQNSYFTLYYSTNKINWTQFTLNNATTSTEGNFTVKTVSLAVLNSGDTLYLKGNATNYFLDNNTVSKIKFSSTGRFNTYGNTMSLLYGDNFANKTTLPSGSTNTFRELFHSSLVVNASKLILPATTLTSHCYHGMFSECSNLVAAPVLPATILAEYCYYYMFYNNTSLPYAPELNALDAADYCYAYMFRACTSLLKAPFLAARTLATGCYQQMFRGCTSLTEVPVLHAVTLVQDCYNSMFQDCSNLKYIKCLATSISASNCTTNWVSNVASAGSFIKEQNISWTAGTDGIPSGWSVSEDIDYANEYLTFTCRLNNSSFKYTNVGNNWLATKLNNGNLSYSRDKITWTRINIASTNTTETIVSNLNDGDKIYLKGTQCIFWDDDEDEGVQLYIDKSFNISGNLLSLEYGDQFQGRNNMPSGVDYCFAHMFEDRNVINAENLIFPSILGYSISNADYIFDSMFYGCGSMLYPPRELPATSLSVGCYRYMFADTKLVKSPILPAQTLTNSCYQRMFRSCTIIKEITMLATDITATNCLDNWVNAAGQTGTFYIDDDCEWYNTIGVSGIPYGWNVVVYGTEPTPAQPITPMPVNPPTPTGPAGSLTPEQLNYLTYIDVANNEATMVITDCNDLVNIDSYAGDGQNIEIDAVYNKISIKAEVKEFDSDRFYIDPLDYVHKAAYIKRGAYEYKTYKERKWKKLWGVFGSGTDVDESTYTIYDRWFYYTKSQINNKPTNSNWQCYANTNARTEGLLAVPVLKAKFDNHFINYTSIDNDQLLRTRLPERYEYQWCTINQQFGWKKGEDVPIKVEWVPYIEFHTGMSQWARYYNDINTGEDGTDGNRKIRRADKAAEYNCASNIRTLWYNMYTNEIMNKPVLEYTGDAAINYTPIDNTTINYICFTGDLLYQKKGTFGSQPDNQHSIYTNADYTSYITFPLIDAGYNGTETVMMERAYNTTDYNKGWETLKCRLQIGDKFWNGTVWTTIPSDFWISYHKENVDGDTEKFLFYEWNRPVTNHTYESGIGKDCWAIPIKWTDNVFGVIDFQIYTPYVHIYNVHTMGPGSGSSVTDCEYMNASDTDSQGAYTLSFYRDKQIPVIFMKDLTLDFVSAPNYNDDRAIAWIDVIDNKEKNDDDIVYTNTINTNNVLEFDDMDLKINTYNPKKPNCDSYILLKESNGGYRYLREPFKDFVNNTQGIQENLLIQQYVNHFNSPKVIYNCEIHNYKEPYKAIKTTSIPDKIFVIDSQEYNIKADVNAVKLIEY